MPHPLGHLPPWPRTYVEARDRWLVKPIRTTRKIQMAWIELLRAQSVDKVPAEKVLKQNFGTGSN